MLPISQHRLRMWLRAERAMGLSYVHLPGGSTGVAESGSVQRASEPLGETLAPENPNIRATAAFEQREPTPVGAVRTPGRAAFSQRPEAEIPPRAPTTLPGLPVLGAPVEAFASPELAPADKAKALAALNEQQVRGCRKCALAATRRSTVFGEGDANARLMFVGEGPGFTEDKTGRPFVGRAGQKLDEMIVAMGFARKQVYICNVVKCRAFTIVDGRDKDRPPLPEEAAACSPYLERQIEIVRPRVIVSLGLSASQNLLGVKESMSRMRGKWRAWREIPVMPTFHPSYILRNYTVETRRAVWEDLKAVKAKLASLDQR